MQLKIKCSLLLTPLVHPTCGAGALGAVDDKGHAVRLVLFYEADSKYKNNLHSSYYVFQVMYHTKQFCQM